MRNALFLALAATLLVGLAALADPEAKPADRKAREPAISAAERESAALAFVRANHPELAALLEPLKAMDPAQYQKAIAELFQVSRTLANLKKNDPRRYEAGLSVWKARSRVEVLAAQLAGAPSPGLEGQLRSAVENQVEAQLAQQKLERTLAEERIKSLNLSIDRMEKNRDALVESRTQGLIKKAARARRRDEGKPSPTKPARATARGESKA